jgi:hypothetical protein
VEDTAWKKKESLELLPPCYDQFWVQRDKLFMFSHAVCFDKYVTKLFITVNDKDAT